MSDILTMVWKESKDLLFQGGWRSLIRPLIVVGIMGIYLPLQFGPQWVDLTPIGMILLLWIPFFVIISFVGDVIAGERERHTLETLLASRMPDRAILLGKVVAIVVDALVLILLASVLGTSAGVLISLRVATVRQAQQILSIGTIVFVFGSIFALRAVPANVLSSLSYAQFLLIVMAVIAVLDAILLGLSLVSFQRSRLILS